MLGTEVQDLSAANGTMHGSWHFPSVLKIGVVRGFIFKSRPSIVFKLMHGERLLVDDDDLASLRVADELLILTYIQEPEFWEGDTVVAETQLMMRAEEGLTSEVIYPNPSSGTRMQMCGLPGDWGGHAGGL